MCPRFTSCDLLVCRVGVCGFEPQTSALSELRSNQLSYTPHTDSAWLVAGQKGYSLPALFGKCSGPESLFLRRILGFYLSIAIFDSVIFWIIESLLALPVLTPSRLTLFLFLTLFCFATQLFTPACNCSLTFVTSVCASIPSSSENDGILTHLLTADHPIQQLTTNTPSDHRIPIDSMYSGKLVKDFCQLTSQRERFSIPSEHTLVFCHVVIDR